MTTFLLYGMGKHCLMKRKGYRDGAIHHLQMRAVLKCGVCRKA